jgi:hypothetical protein
MQSALNIDTHHASEHPTMLVELDGPTLRNPDGTVLAELHQGCWLTPDGLPCTALEVPAVKARPRVPAAAQAAARHERDEAWMSCALEAIRQLSQQQATLTSDDVWAAITMPPRQSRMIGNALARAQRAGVIEKTEEHRPSVRRENHSRPVRVWNSRLHGQLTR